MVDRKSARIEKEFVLLRIINVKVVVIKLTDQSIN